MHSMHSHACSSNACESVFFFVRVRARILGNKASTLNSNSVSAFALRVSVAAF
jgi:hypothetical protein